MAGSFTPKPVNHVIKTLKQDTYFGEAGTISSPAYHDAYQARLTFQKTS